MELVLAQAATAAGGLDEDIRRALMYVPTFAAVLVRVGAMFIFAPLFGSGRIPKRVKAALALTLAAALTPTVGPVAFPETIWAMAVAVAGEIVFGLAMGMAMSLVFVAAQWAGEVIGQQLGFNLGEVFDPQFGASGSIVSDLLFMLTLVIFLCLRGHHAMLMGLHDSVQQLPLFTAGMGPGGLDLITGLLGACTALAVKLTAPVLVAMLISDVTLGFVSKSMPQLNVMSIGMNMRSMLGLMVMAAGLVITSETMTNAILDAMGHTRQAWVTSWVAETPVPINGAPNGGN